MAQTMPTYGYATGKAEAPIVNSLVKKYGDNNVSWPIVLSNEVGTIAYIYERNNKNGINNRLGDIRPTSQSNIPDFFLDYISNPREICPNAPHLSQLILPEYDCSYDYILRSGTSLATYDLDYVWYDGKRFKGFELTTFYVQFSSHAKALDLISKMNRRPSWKSATGVAARTFHRIVDSASDLGVDYYLVCANTITGVGGALMTQGNVCILQMTHEQINRIESGVAPNNSIFMPFSDFISWL